MTVLVTGGAGYIGSHMALALIDAGEKVVVLDDLSTGFRWAVPEGVPLVVGDFGDENLVTETIARYKVERDRAFRRQDRRARIGRRSLGYYLNNTAKARTLLECGGEARGRALHLLLDRGGLRRSVEEPGD